LPITPQNFVERLRILNFSVVIHFMLYSVANLKHISSV
jgi:hypothetical protein